MSANENVRNILPKRSDTLILHPQSNEILLFQQGEFKPYVPSNELPQSPSSIDWYRGWRQHLGFAQICPKLPTENPSYESITTVI